MVIAQWGITLHHLKLAFVRQLSYQEVMTKASAETRLMNKAVNYLGRYASSSYKLGEVLGRFAARKLADYDPDEVDGAIASTISRCASLGYVDDFAFATAQARNHRRLGRSASYIEQRLRQHRLDDRVIRTALDAADNSFGNSDLCAAFTFARRRRIGPFDLRQEGPENADPAERMKRRQRELGALARAGFAADVCLRVINTESDAEAEAIINMMQYEEGLST